MEYTQEVKFFYLCKVFVTIDRLNLVSNEINDRMKALIMYRKHESFDLYFDQIRIYLLKQYAINYKTMSKCPQMSTWIGHLKVTLRY